MIIPMLCVTIFVILVVWFLLPRVARLMIHTPTAISIFVCLSMVQLMAVFISMRCTLCGHFLQVALTLILVVWFLLPRVARLMIHTPTAISIFVCLSMVQLMAVFISMRCTLCGHFLQVALTLRGGGVVWGGWGGGGGGGGGVMVTVCPSQF